MIFTNQGLFGARYFFEICNNSFLPNVIVAHHYNPVRKAIGVAMDGTSAHFQQLGILFFSFFLTEDASSCRGQIMPDRSSLQIRVGAEATRAACIWGQFGVITSSSQELSCAPHTFASLW